MVACVLLCIVKIYTDQLFIRYLSDNYEVELTAVVKLVYLAVRGYY